MVPLGRHAGAVFVSVVSASGCGSFLKISPCLLLHLLSQVTWRASPFEESQALKPPELGHAGGEHATTISYPALVAFWAHISIRLTWSLFLIHPAGWLSVRGLNLFKLFFCFFRRYHRVSPPRGRLWPTREDRRSRWQARGGRRGSAGRKHPSLGSGIFVFASCQLNHEQGCRCTQRWQLHHCATRCLLKSVLLPVCFVIPLTPLPRYLRVKIRI